MASKTHTTPGFDLSPDTSNYIGKFFVAEGSKKTLTVKSSNQSIDMTDFTVTVSSVEVAEEEITENNRQKTIYKKVDSGTNDPLTLTPTVTLDQYAYHLYFDDTITMVEDLNYPDKKYFKIEITVDDNANVRPSRWIDVIIVELIGRDGV